MIEAENNEMDMSLNFNEEGKWFNMRISSYIDSYS